MSNTAGIVPGNRPGWGDRGGRDDRRDEWRDADRSKSCEGKVGAAAVRASPGAYLTPGDQEVLFGKIMLDRGDSSCEGPETTRKLV